MISEQYVSYKTAKLLKQAGFNEKCKSFYRFGTSKIRYWEEGSVLSNREMEQQLGLKNISAPTQAFAERWLREYEDFHVNVLPLPHNKWYAGVVIIGLPNKLDGRLGAYFLEDEEFSSYEDAVEATLQFILKSLVDGAKKAMKMTDEQKAELERELEEKGFDFGD